MPKLLLCTAKHGSQPCFIDAVFRQASHFFSIEIGKAIKHFVGIFYYGMIFFFEYSLRSFLAIEKFINFSNSTNYQYYCFLWHCGINVHYILLKSTEYLRFIVFFITQACQSIQ
eukprot:NODE_144_length_17694_cov_0.489741.p14 type:complete len:114 gc:universal NODE_144_length_17694_cov_0.489741:9515-9856(+)